MEVVNKYIFELFRLIIFLVVLIFMPKLSAEDLKLELSKSEDGGVVSLEVSVVNISDRELVVPLLFIPEDYYIKFDIRDQYNNRAKFIGHEIDLIESSKDYLYMFPESKFIQKIDLMRFYSIEKNGCYSVKAIYTIVQDRRPENFTWVGQLTSNKILACFKES